VIHQPGRRSRAFRGKTAGCVSRAGAFRPVRAGEWQLTGRIVLGKDFDSELGTRHEALYEHGSNQGVKVGDYFRVVRSYESTLKDPVESLSFEAQTSEDTQVRPPILKPIASRKPKGQTIHVRDLPRRAVGEVVVLNVTPTSSSAMVSSRWKMCTRATRWNWTINSRDATI